MTDGMGFHNTGATGDLVRCDDSVVLELEFEVGFEGGAQVQSIPGETQSGIEYFVPGDGNKKYRISSEVGVSGTGYKGENSVRYDSWLDWLFDRNSKESLEERAEQARRHLHDDEDITDETHKKLDETHTSLGFTLDKVVKDLRNGGRR